MQITQSKKDKVEDYIIIKKLGEGCCGKVLLAQHKTTKEKFAFKILNKNPDTKIFTEKSLKNEFEIMKNLNHKNIIKFYTIEKGIHKKKNKKSEFITFGKIEFSSNGDIHEILSKVISFNENLTRFYALQILDALEYLHKKDITHRDLKPQNLLLDENYNLKLADFGFATKIYNGEKIKGKLGTYQFMAPEIFLGHFYDAKKVDIFSFGVVLFYLYSGNLPFDESGEFRNCNDFNNKCEEFWKLHQEKNFQKNYSENLIDLLNNILVDNPDERFSLEEIRNSYWMKEKINYQKARRDIKKYIRGKKIYDEYYKIRDDLENNLDEKYEDEKYEDKEKENFQENNFFNKDQNSFLINNSKLEKEFISLVIKN